MSTKNATAALSHVAHGLSPDETQALVDSMSLEQLRARLVLELSRVASLKDQLARSEASLEETTAALEDAQEELEAIRAGEFDAEDLLQAEEDGLLF